MNSTSYQLDDLLLFSPDVYFSSIAFYNLSIWPLPIAAILLSFIFFWLTLRLSHQTLTHQKTMAAWLILTLAWAWCGAIYHLKFYQQINWMAFYFGWVFIAQSALMTFWLARFYFQADQLKPTSTWQTNLGIFFIWLSVFTFPLIGLIDGPSIKASLIFSISPAPTILATFGFFLVTDKAPWSVLIIPVGVSIIDLLTSYTIGSAQIFAYFLCLVATLTIFANRLKKPSLKHSVGKT